MANQFDVECVWVRLELAERQPTPEEARRMREHLAACPACRQACDCDRELARRLRDSPFPATPVSIEQRVRLLLARRRTVRSSAVAATVATAATLLICWGAVWWTRGRPGHPVSTPAGDFREVSAAESLPLETLTVLLAAPPVPTLDRPQSAWLAVLTEASEGDIP